MVNVALYLRKSREDDELKDETLARHEKMLLDYCARNGLHISRTYKEVVSGENIQNRPQMQALLDDVAAGLFDGVVCIELERLSRGNPIDQCEILDTFKASKTKIYTLQKVYDLTKEELDEEYFEFALFMSRREYKTIKRRLLRGRMQAAQEGYYTNSHDPFGYDRQKTEKGFVLSENKKEADIVRLIFSRYVSGIGAYRIADELNAMGAWTKKGCAWTAPAIIRLIQNQLYIGKIHIWKYNKWVEGKHEGIINPDIFSKAQLLHSTKSPKVRQKYEPKNPFSGFTYCGYCDRLMQRTHRNGQIKEYLVCVNPMCECRKSVRLDKLEPMILTELKEISKNFNYFLEEDEPETNETELLTAELKTKEKQIDRACEMLEQNIYDVETFKKRTDKIHAEIEKIKEKLLELETPKPYKNTIPNLEKVFEQYSGLDIASKNKLLRAVIKKITITPKGNDFNLKIDLFI